MTNTIAKALKIAAMGLAALALVAFISACSSSFGSDDEAAAGEVAEHVEDVHEEGDEHAEDEHADDAHADDAHAEGDEHGSSTVHVALSEWSIEPAHGAAFEAAAGDVMFEIHNEGAAPHDFKIVRTDLAPDALPISDGVVDMEAAGEVIGGTEPLPGDIEIEEEYDLEEGSYVFLCSIPGHYQQGMHAGFTVE